MKRIYVQLDEQAKMVGNEDISPSQIEVICTVDPSYDSKKSAEAVLEFLEFLPINTLKELYRHPRFQEGYRALGSL